MIGKIGVSVPDARKIASVLSGDLRVNISEGPMWAYDFTKKTIYYRPWDLAELTELEVTANLLHEAGHANYSIGPKKCKWHKKITKDHTKKLGLLVNVIEDFRIEDKLRKEYPYAKNYLPEYSFKTKFILEQYFIKYSFKRKPPKYLQYCFSIYSLIAELKPRNTDFAVRRAVKKTQEFAKKARYTKGDQEIADVIGEKIYDHIKKFLDEWDDDSEEKHFTLTEIQPPAQWIDPYKEIKHLVNRTVRVFERILTDVKFDKFAGKYRSGKLNAKKLYKSRTGDLKLFERRIEAKTKNYAFSLVVDESGSMRGEPSEVAVKTAALFSAVLGKLKIPYSLHGFNEEIHHYKGFQKEINVETSEIFREMYLKAYGVGAGYNHDGLAVKEVRERFNAQARKIMFVISDGQEAPPPAGKVYPLRAEIAKTLKEGIEIVAFGIGGDQIVDEYYKDYVVVRNLDELPQLILKKLKNKLK